MLLSLHVCCRCLDTWRGIYKWPVYFYTSRGLFLPQACLQELSRHWPSPADCTHGVGTPSSLIDYIVQASVTPILFRPYLGAIVTYLFCASYRVDETSPPINNNVCFYFSAVLLFCAKY